MKSSYAYLQKGILFHIEVLLVNDDAVANIIGVNYVFMFPCLLQIVITSRNTVVLHTGWLWPAFVSDLQIACHSSDDKSHEGR